MCLAKVSVNTDKIPECYTGCISLCEYDCLQNCLRASNISLSHDELINQINYNQPKLYQHWCILSVVYSGTISDKVTSCHQVNTTTLFNVSLANIPFSNLFCCLAHL